MWIRSQDKEELVNVQRLSVIDKRVVAVNSEKDGDYTYLGKYESKERTLKVLDNIQQQIISATSSDNIYDDGQTINHYEVVFEMPKECE